MLIITIKSLLCKTDLRSELFAVFWNGGEDMDIKRISRLNNSIINEADNTKNDKISDSPNNTEYTEATDSFIFSIYEKLKKASMQKEIVLKDSIESRDSFTPVSEFSERELKVIDEILSKKKTKKIEDIPEERIKKLFEDID